MPISNLSAFNSAIVPGYVQGESLQADLVQRQEQARQARIQTQEMMDERLALSALGKAFGMAPPPPPMPQGAGQPSVPATSTGAPIVPPGGQFGVQAPPGGAASAGPPAMPAPQGGPPPPPQATAPIAPGQAGPTSRPPWATPQPQPQPQPAPALPPQQAQPAAPSIPPQIQQNLGQMTTEQLAQRIIAANPDIKDRPDLLVRAMAKGQALLAPDAKATLALLQIDQRLQAAETKVDIARMNNETKEAIANQLADVRQKIEGLKQQGADERQAKALQEKIDELTAKLQAKHEDVAATDTSREKVAEIGAGSREKVAEINAASREKIAFASNISKEKVAEQKVTAQKELAAGQLSPQSLTFYAQALRAGNLQAVGQVLGMSKNRSGIMDQIVKEAQVQDPDFDGAKITSAMLQLGGQKAAAGVVGRTAGGVAVGAEELPVYLPQIERAIRTVNTSKYPTINSIIQAYDKGVGDPEVVFLRNMVQGARNAYQQIAARGGRMTVFGAQQAQDLISGNMPVGQFVGAARALTQEAEINKGATGAAMQEVTKQDQGGTMITDARKVARMRGAGDDAAYEKARDDYLKRYGKHGGEEALRKALKDSAAPAAIPDGAPTASDDQGNKVYWDGTAWKPAPKD